jgi:hypothetical protein
LKPVQVNSSKDPISKKTLHPKGLVEWPKVKALSSNLSTTKKQKKTEWCQQSHELGNNRSFSSAAFR